MDDKRQSDGGVLPVRCELNFGHVMSEVKQ